MQRLLQSLLLVALFLRQVCGDVHLRRSLIEREENDCQTHAKETTFYLSPDLMLKTLHAAELSALTYKLFERFSRFRPPPYSEHFESMAQFHDFDDAALVAQRNKVCYAAFRSTSPLNPSDLWQVFDGRKTELNGCVVRRGFHRAYFARYYDKFLQKIDECMQTGTELIVTGHSQGGSNAMIAMMDLKERYNPTAITFGAVRALVEPCAAIDATRIYRYTNVGYQLYDGWSNCDKVDGVHMGHSIMLDANSSSPAVYLGLNEDLTRGPIDRDVHESSLYWEALEAMATKAETECAGGPIRLRGFENGHWCTQDNECALGGGCTEGFCRANT